MKVFIYIPDDLSFVYDLFKIGEKSRKPEILRQNIENAIRRADCLSAIEAEYFTETMNDEEEPYEHCQLSWGDRPERYSKVFGDVLQEKTNQAINALSQVEWDGTPSFYIGVSDVCTHRMSELDIPVWCKDADSALTAMNFINNYQQPKTEPKRWTVADQKAGRLPEVGNHLLTEGNLAEFIGLSNAPNNWCFRRLDGEWGIQTANKDWFSPIETPEEKAQREEDEFIDSLKSVEINDGTVRSFFAQGARTAYRKLKGGD